METNTTVAPARPEGLPANNHTHNLHSQPPIHNQPHEASPSTSTIIIIILPTITIVLLLAIILVVAVMLRRLKSAKNNGSTKSNNCINRDCVFVSERPTSINITSPDVKGGCLYGGNPGRIPTAKCRAVQVFTYKELEAATDKFSEANVVGNGGFGVVYRGVLGDGTVAAIKRLNREGKQGERAFRIEVDLLSRLQSPYLVELLGYCADQHHRLLIFEFMSNGTLRHYLHHPSHIYPPQPLNWGTRLRIALNCARALEFIHEHTVPSIIHRDFNSSNILLDQYFRAKVSDLGLAKTGSEKINGQISTRVLGTTGYLAPE